MNPKQWRPESKSPGKAKSPQKNIGKAKNRKTFNEKGKSTKLRRKKKKNDDEGPKVQKSRTSEEVKFNLNIKEPEVRPDEFDDDEENPLAKIHIKSREKHEKASLISAQNYEKIMQFQESAVVKEKSKIGKEGTKSTSKTTSTASPGPGFSPIPSQENEAPLFAANEKQIGSSTYVRLD
ncbi:unnamed protein product [Caenorhabditis nigoni]